MSRPNIGRILVPFDGSDNAVRACELAALLAGRLGSEVRLLYVIPPLSIYTAPISDEYYAVQKEAADAQVRRGDEVCERLGVKSKSVVVPARWSIVETIVNYASEQKVGLIVVGARGQGGFKKLLVGSVSAGVVAHAYCPVLVVR